MKNWNASVYKSCYETPQVWSVGTFHILPCDPLAAFRKASELNFLSVKAVRPGKDMF